MSVNTKVNGQLVPSAGLYKVRVPIQSGDIYSTEERQVGVWTDGKPLYQKTLYIASLPSSKSTGTYSLNVSNAENCWVVDANSGTSNLDMVRVAEASVSNMQSASIYARCAVVDGDVKVYVEVGRDRSSMSAYVTVRYTKTTDVAGSGEYVPSGDKAVHYSTDEEVIGTFLGETLYRKTIDTGSIPNNTTKTVAHGISNLKYIRSISGGAKNPTVNYFAPLPYVQPDDAYQITVYADLTNINITSTSNMEGYSQSYITLEYTKTS